MEVLNSDYYEQFSNLLIYHFRTNILLKDITWWTEVTWQQAADAAVAEQWQNSSPLLWQMWTTIATSTKKARVCDQYTVSRPTANIDTTPVIIAMVVSGETCSAHDLEDETSWVWVPAAAFSSSRNILEQDIRPNWLWSTQSIGSG